MVPKNQNESKLCPVLLLITELKVIISCFKQFNKRYYAWIKSPFSSESTREREEEASAHSRELRYEFDGNCFSDGWRSAEKENKVHLYGNGLGYSSRRICTVNKANVNVSCSVNKRDIHMQNLDRIHPTLHEVWDESSTEQERKSEPAARLQMSNKMEQNGLSSKCQPTQKEQMSADVSPSDPICFCFLFTRVCSWLIGLHCARPKQP